MTFKVREHLDFIKVLIDHKNLKHFMTFKQLNRKQTRWVEFLFEFNFKITYKSNVQDIKSNSFTRRFANLSKFDDNDDERKKYNYVKLLKKKHLNKEVRNVVTLVVALLNENRETIVRFVVMLYDLSEKNSLEKQKNDEIFFTNNLEKNNEREIDETLLFDIFNDQSNIMKLIRTIYFDDIILQRVMKIKRESKRQMSMNITRIELKLKFKECEIKDDLFYVRERIYVSQDETFHVFILKLMHDFSFARHARRATTYDRVNTYYYWSRMIATITQYIKTCLHCKRTKYYRDEKQNLLKSLLILERYFQDIFLDFITSLSICRRNDRNYQHIMITICVMVPAVYIVV